MFSITVPLCKHRGDLQSERRGQFCMGGFVSLPQRRAPQNSENGRFRRKSKSGRCLAGGPLLQSSAKSLILNGLTYNFGNVLQTHKHTTLDKILLKNDIGKIEK